MPQNLLILLPNERLNKKIAEISTSRNKKELQSLLGLTNFFYSKSIYPDTVSDLIEPFAKLRKKNVELILWKQKK